MADLRQPSIQGNDHEKIQAIISYIYQLREQLQYEFDNLDINGAVGGGGIIQNSTTIVNPGGQSNEQNAEATFESIKGFIIKSSDIINSYYTRINELILESGIYVAQDGFNTYKSEMETKLFAENGAITVASKKLEQVSAVYQTDEYAKEQQSSGYVKAGYLDNNAFGVEIGFKDANEIKSSAQFTSNRISFYDLNGVEGAWIDNQRMHAKRFEAEEEFYLGGFYDTVDDSGNVTTRWVREEAE